MRRNSYQSTEGKLYPQAFGVPADDECRDNGLITTGRGAEEVDHRDLLLEMMVVATCIGYFFTEWGDYASGGDMVNWRVFFSAFLGKIAACLLVASCIAFGFGPDKWAAFLITGVPVLITPGVARLSFLLIGSLTLLSLLRGTIIGARRRWIKIISIAAACLPFVAGAFYITANSPTIKPDFVRLVEGGARYEISPYDQVILVATQNRPTTIILPIKPKPGHRLEIKDKNGKSFFAHIIIDGNGKNIDGQPKQEIGSNFASITLVYDGEEWGNL